MSKSTRKQAQREAVQRAREQRLDAIQHPDLPPNELQEFQRTCDEMYAMLDQLSLPASVSTKLVHDQPTPCSHVGGEMLVAPGSEWPTSNGALMTGVFELVISELPFVPDQLQGSYAMQLFLELVEGEHDPEYRDGAAHVRLLSNNEGLQPASEGKQLGPYPIAFAREDSIPNYPDDLDVIPSDLKERFEALPNWSELLVTKYPTAHGLRIGGWPYWIEGSGVRGDFVFQVDGPTIGVDLSFDGVLYFGFDSKSGCWHHSWEIG